jgi:outer membrane protein TolC
MKKLLTIWGSSFFLMLQAFPQNTDSISLVECLSWAETKFTGNKQAHPLEQASDFRIKNYNRLWLPSMGLAGQATYQSEIVQFRAFDPVSQSIVPIDLPLDQYKLQLEFSQQLFDGGLTRARKDMEKGSKEINLQQIAVERNGFRQAINHLYFSVLLTDKGYEIITLSLEELKEKIAVMRALVDHGALLAGNLMVMEAEELFLRQKLLEISHSRISMLNQLSVLLDTVINPSTRFLKPAFFQSRRDSILRPEHRLYDLQKQQLVAGKKLLTAADMPRLFAFSQAGYGRPGYDFLSETFHDYYLVGIGLKWDFFNYGETGRQKKIIDLDQQLVDIRRESFDKSIASSMVAELENINKFREMIEMDRKIIALRRDVTSSSFARLTKGVITPTDFLAAMNAETEARLQLENHEIMLLQSIYNYLLIKGEI